MKFASYIRYSAFVLAIVASAQMLTSCNEEDYQTPQTDPNKYGAPSISNIAPSEGVPTSIVTITGSNFGDVRTDGVFVGRVYFGQYEAAEYVSWSDSQIQVRVPEKASTGNITVWAWKYNDTSVDEFTVIPGAEITGISPESAAPGDEITLYGKNFDTFIEKGLTANEITVTFQRDGGGTTSVMATSFTAEAITAVVPSDAVAGTITVSLGSFQNLTGPALVIAGSVSFSFTEYLDKAGTVTVSDGCIDSTKDGAYVIFKFKAPTTGFFQAFTKAATKNNGSYLNLEIGDDLEALKTASLKENHTVAMTNTGSWNDDVKSVYGPWWLEGKKDYYLKVSFLQDGTTWVGNLHEMGLTLIEGEVEFAFLDYIESQGTVTVSDGCIDSTKDGAWVIFGFTAPTTANFIAYTEAATKNNGSYLNIEIGNDLNALKTAMIKDNHTVAMTNTGSWNDDVRKTYGPWNLTEGEKYYLKVTFLQDGTTWVGNLHKMGITLSAD